MSGERFPVSLLISARNEQDSIVGLIEACSDRVSEVVLVDMESSDRTVELARERGAVIVEVPAAGFAEPGRQAGIDAASQPWLLMLDADERPGKRFWEEVARQISRDHAAGVRFPAREPLHGTADEALELVARLADQAFQA